ncbi:MAG: hypothetical protein ACHQF0_10980 [Chitinophagales bacterium]
MWRSFAFLFCLAVLASPGCKKDFQKTNGQGKDTQTNSSTYISWKACSQTNYGNDLVDICFDSLLEDSRCPMEVECFWRGTAVAKFSFSVNNNEQDITLSLFNLPGIYPSDTVLMGYKIEFLDLKPYPQINVERKPSDYTAEVRITKQ